jgi:hypothetical protein
VYTFIVCCALTLSQDIALPAFVLYLSFHPACDCFILISSFILNFLRVSAFHPPPCLAYIVPRTLSTTASEMPLLCHWMLFTCVVTSLPSLILSSLSNCSLARSTSSMFANNSFSTLTWTTSFLKSCGIGSVVLTLAHDHSLWTCFLLPFPPSLVVCRT